MQAEGAHNTPTPPFPQHPRLSSQPWPPRTDTHAFKLGRQFLPPGRFLSLSFLASHHPEQQAGPESRGHGIGALGTQAVQEGFE